MSGARSGRLRARRQEITDRAITSLKKSPESNEHERFAVTTDGRRDVANRLGDIAERRDDEDERHAVREGLGRRRPAARASLLPRLPRELRDRPRPRVSPITASTAAQACCLAVGVSSPTGSPSGSTKIATRPVAARPRPIARSAGCDPATSRHSGKEDDRGPRARSSPRPVDERRQSGHAGVVLAHVPGEHASDATEHGPVVRSSEPDGKPRLGPHQRGPLR